MCHRLVKYLSGSLCKCGSQSPLPRPHSAPAKLHLIFLPCALGEYPHVTANPCYLSTVPTWVDGQCRVCLLILNCDASSYLKLPERWDALLFPQEKKKKWSEVCTLPRVTLSPIPQWRSVTKIQSGASDWNSLNAMWWQTERPRRDAICQDPDRSRPSRRCQFLQGEGGRRMKRRLISQALLFVAAATHYKLSAACKYINVVLEGKKNKSSRWNLLVWCGWGQEGPRLGLLLRKTRAAMVALLSWKNHLSITG